MNNKSTVVIVGYEKTPVQRRRIACNACQAILEYGESDVEHVTTNCMGRENSEDGMIWCPGCKHRVLVERDYEKIGKLVLS